jgi:hypothetical protein
LVAAEEFFFRFAGLIGSLRGELFFVLEIFGLDCERLELRDLLRLKSDGDSLILFLEKNIFPKIFLYKANYSKKND